MGAVEVNVIVEKTPNTSRLFTEACMEVLRKRKDREDDRVRKTVGKAAG